MKYAGWVERPDKVTMRRSGSPSPSQDVVTSLAEEHVVAGTAGQGIVAIAAEKVGRRQRPVGLVQREIVVAVQTEDLNERGVGDRRRTTLI